MRAETLLTKTSFMLAAVVAAGIGCSSKNQQEMVRPMGEKVQVGPLVYSVLDAEWRTQLGDSGAPRIPKDRFLVLRLTITNSGGGEVSVPLLNVEDQHGASHMELQQGEGVEQWLGLLRTIPAERTEEGRIVFDVPLLAYKLRVTDGAEPGQEETALINIPLRLGGEAPTLSLPMPEPGTQR